MTDDQPDGYLWHSAPCAGSFPDRRTIRVTLSRLKFMGQDNPHDWKAWSLRKIIPVKRKRGHNGQARGGR